MTRFAFLLGNGPSLKGFDFNLLRGFHSLGMNAAYRYWDTIDWYPSYYCCLDDQLIESHHDEINRLYESGLVKDFFVHWQFFDHHPDKIGHPAFVSLDQVLPHWFNRRGKDLGLQPLFEHPAFKCSDTTKVTTGAFALRYMAYKGHDRIALMGIDLKYVEILPEAKPTEGVGLVMEKTPESNPNYFFDSYQKAGDRYNIPNPAVHNGDLHPRSFEIVAHDFRQNGVQCEVVNTNPESVLQQRGIFPLKSREEVLDRPLLGSITVPTNIREVDAIIGNFKVWSQDGFRPFVERPPSHMPALVLAFNSDPDAETKERITDAYLANGMERFFAGLVILDCGLEGERDIYRREYEGEVGKEGFKAGPNNQFLESMRHAAPFGRYTFLMETDCAPLRAGWLTRLMQYIAGAEPFWIMGSAYRGVDTLDPRFAKHINGNAVYATGDPTFREFLSNYWEPRMRRAVEVEDSRLAYDCILERGFYDVRDGESWPLWQKTAHKFRFTNYIQNISARKDMVEEGQAIWRRIRDSSPDTYLLHNANAASYLRSSIG